MGACASLPKGMKEEAMAAPEPLPTEESVQADQHNTEEVVKVEKEENKTGEVDESKQQALGSLLDDQHEKTEGKKEPNDQAQAAQQPQVEAPSEPKKEEPQPEPKIEEAKVEAEKEEAKVEPKEEEAKPEQAAAAPREMKE